MTPKPAPHLDWREISTHHIVHTTSEFRSVLRGLIPYHPARLGRSWRSSTQHAGSLAHHIHTRGYALLVRQRTRLGRTVTIQRETQSRAGDIPVRQTPATKAPEGLT